MAQARALGVAVEGICWYPITDYPGWMDDRHCPTGLFGYVEADGSRPFMSLWPRNSAFSRVCQRSPASGKVGQSENPPEGPSGGLEGFRTRGDLLVAHHRRLPDTILHHRRPDQALEDRRGLPHAMAQGEHLLGSLSASLAHLLETRRLTQKVNRRGRHPLPIAWIRACDIRPSAGADQNAIVPLSISSATPPTPMAIIGQPQAIPSKRTSGMASLGEV